MEFIGPGRIYISMNAIRFNIHGDLNYPLVNVYSLRTGNMAHRKFVDLPNFKMVISQLAT
jgi:hypothetical protein